MNRFFSSTITFIIPLILAPFTLLLILSQNTVPGDLLYPYKRGVEIMVLTAASLHPETRVAFRTDLTERRFNEAETLLLAKQDVVALETFLKEVRETETAIANVPDVQKKEELKQTLIAKIDDYQVRLTQIETKVSSAPPLQGSSSQNQNNSFPTSTPVPIQQDTSITVPTREPDQIIPTSAPMPTLIPTVDVGAAIARTKDELEKIKDKTKKEKEEDDKEESKERRNSDKHDDDDDGDDKKSNKRGVDKD